VIGGTPALHNLVVYQRKSGTEIMRAPADLGDL